MEEIRNEEVMENNEVWTGEVEDTEVAESSNSGTLAGVLVGAIGTLAVVGTVKVAKAVKAKISNKEDKPKKEKKQHFWNKKKAADQDTDEPIDVEATIEDIEEESEE